MTDKNKTTLRKIKHAYETNNVEVTTKVNAIFGEVNELTDVLLEKHNELGDTPILEPELFKVLEKGKGIFDFAKHLAEKFNIKASDFDTVAFASFVNKCKDKITLLTNEKGEYKSTEKTKDAKMPTFDDLEALGKFSIKRDDLIKEYYDEVIGIDMPDEAKEELEKLQKKEMTLIYKITGVKATGLTDWEKALLKENVLTYATNALKTSLGRGL